MQFAPDYNANTVNQMLNAAAEFDRQKQIRLKQAQMQYDMANIAKDPDEQTAARNVVAGNTSLWGRLTGTPVESTLAKKYRPPQVDESPLQNLGPTTNNVTVSQAPVQNKTRNRNETLSQNTTGTIQDADKSYLDAWSQHYQGTGISANNVQKFLSNDSNRQKALAEAKRRGWVKTPVPAQTTAIVPTNPPVTQQQRDELSNGFQWREEELNKAQRLIDAAPDERSKMRAYQRYYLADQNILSHFNDRQSKPFPPGYFGIGASGQRTGRGTRAKQSPYYYDKRFIKLTDEEVRNPRLLRKALVAAEVIGPKDSLKRSLLKSASPENTRDAKNKLDENKLLLTTDKAYRAKAESVLKEFKELESGDQNNPDFQKIYKDRLKKTPYELVIEPGAFYGQNARIRLAGEKPKASVDY